MYSFGVPEAHKSKDYCLGILDSFRITNIRKPGVHPPGRVVTTDEQRIPKVEKPRQMRDANERKRPSAYVAASKLEGEIVAISNDIAIVDMGGAHGIRRGMKLSILRGSRSLGHLRITLVDPHQAAGIVMEKGIEIAVGDKVSIDKE